MQYVKFFCFSLETATLIKGYVDSTVGNMIVDVTSILNDHVKQQQKQVSFLDILKETVNSLAKNVHGLTAGQKQLQNSIGNIMREQGYLKAKQDQMFRKQDQLINQFAGETTDFQAVPPAPNSTSTPTLFEVA